MTIIIAIIILVLICVLFYKEIKNNKEVDLFFNLITTFIGIGISLFSLFDINFNFKLIETYVYILTIIITLIFTIYYLIKHKKTKISE